MWDELGKREPKGMENSVRDCDSHLDVIEIWPRMGIVQMENYLSEQGFSDNQFQNLC